MAIAVVQSKNGITFAGSTIAGTFVSNTTTGNTLVVVAHGYNGSSILTVSSIAISAGAATFSKQIGQGSPGGAVPSAEGWAAANITGGTTPTITVTFSGVPSFGDVFLYELSGMPTSLTADGTPAGTLVASTTTPAAPAITTTGSNTIIFAGFGPAQSMTAGEAGWTAMVGAGGSSANDLAEYKIFSSGQSALVATATQSPAGEANTIVFALQGTTAVTHHITSTIAAAAAMSGGVKRLTKTSMTI